MKLSPNIFKQISEAYRAMADKVKYRPSAPNDGYGNITVAEDQLNITRECEQYAQHWWEQEDSRSYRIGCPDFRMRKGMIFAAEAAHQMCTGVSGLPYAIKLLKLAVKDLEELQRSSKRAA